MIEQTDPAIYELIKKEEQRQVHNIELIASENIVSGAVQEAQGSVLTNKYAEGYPGKRFYGGCEFIDQIESLAIERAKQLLMQNMPMYNRTPVRRLIWQFTKRF